MNEYLYYAIYSRKSKFTGKGESIENQIELCKNHLINKYGTNIKDKILIYQDEGFTGYNTNRPEFQKMIQESRRKNFKIVLCWKFDRIGRNAGDFYINERKLLDNGVKIESITEQIPDGPVASI